MLSVPVAKRYLTAATRGFRHFVNIKGATESPKGKTVNTKNRDTDEPGKRQENPRKN